MRTAYAPLAGAGAMVRTSPVVARRTDASPWGSFEMSSHVSSSGPARRTLLSHSCVR